MTRNHPAKSFTTTIDTIHHKMRKRYKTLKSWESVGVEFQVTKAMAWRICNEPDYEPKDTKIRARLNLPIFKPAPVCNNCGEVHITKRCATKPRKYPDLFSIPIKQLRAMLDNREELK